MSPAVIAAPSATERLYLEHARNLALNGRGRVSPNPLVGAVVVRDGEVIAEGWHEGPGTAHAEVMALTTAGAAARGATVVCTLEPCSHHGRTPPCANALVAAGVRRVVVGCRDPLERDRLGGAGVLAAAGVEVVMADETDAAECREQIAPFITHALTGRPEVLLKLATSLDGKVATEDGETRWITGSEARALVHRWRADVDAVVVGIGTVLADDPQLTARDVPGAFRQPRRVIFDGAARLSDASKLVATLADSPVMLIVGPQAPLERVRVLQRAGVEVISPGGAPQERVGAALDALGERDVQSVLLEGGPTLAGAFLAADAVDRVEWFVAPKLIGGDAAPSALAGAGLGALQEVPHLQDVHVSRVGADIRISGRLRPLVGS